MTLSKIKILFNFRVTIKKKKDKILEFEQEPFLQPYIESNTDLRRK